MEQVRTKKSEGFYLTPEQLRALQMCLREILCEIKRICEKHNITYSLGFGTMLGAVRHRGFIPWDDDADICMTRPNYEKFKAVCATELGEIFYFQDNMITPGYRWGYGKVRMRGTKMVRTDQVGLPYEQGVFVDVFPVDPAPQGLYARKLLNGICVLIRKTLWSPIGKHIEERPLIRFGLALLSQIPYRYVLSAYRRIIDWSGKWDSDWVRFICWPTYCAEYGHLKKWYEELSTYEFEGELFPGASDFHGYLSSIYGDWRTLPPPEKRRAFAFSELELLSLNTENTGD